MSAYPSRRRLLCVHRCSSAYLALLKQLYIPLVFLDLAQSRDDVQKVLDDLVAEVSEEIDRYKGNLNNDESFGIKWFEIIIY